MTARALQTKTKIFDAMVSLMGDRGYQGVSIDEICAEAGVSKGTIYYYFKNKAEMMESLLEDRFAPAVKIIDDTASKAQEDPMAALIEMIKLEFDYFLDQRSFTRFLLSELWRVDRGWNEAIIRVRNEIVARIETVLEEGVKQKVFRSDMPRDYAATTVFGLTAITVLDCLIFNENKDVEQSKKDLIYVITNAAQAS